MLPRTLGRYEILSRLDAGGMGRVYKARDPMIDRAVAIKTLGVKLEDEQFAEFKARLFREARSAPVRKLEREPTPPATGA
jgi:serine/threonine protein kinase